MGKVTTILNDGVSVRFKTVVRGKCDLSGSFVTNVEVNVELVVRYTVVGLDVLAGVAPTSPNTETLALGMNCCVDVTDEHRLVQRDFIFWFVDDVLAEFTPTEVVELITTAQRLASRNIGL